MPKGRLAARAKGPSLRKMAPKPPVGEGMSAAQIKAWGGSQRPAPPSPPPPAPAEADGLSMPPVGTPTPGLVTGVKTANMPTGRKPFGPLCVAVGCGHVPVRATPRGMLCKTCHDSYRGHPDLGCRYTGYPPGVAPPFRGFKDDPPEVIAAA